MPTFRTHRTCLKAALVVALVAGAASCGSRSAPTRSRVPPEGDALIFQRVLDGTLPAADGLAQVSRSNGWPISTSQGLIFAALDGGLGPYALRSPAGAFATVVLRTEMGVAWTLASLPATDGVDYEFVTRYGDPFPDPWSRRFRYALGGQVSVVAASGPHLERWPGVGDAAISARTLRVWVPAGAATRILYAHDGQNLFDPAGPWSGWRLDLAAGPGTLVVGIDNSAARLDEYTPVQDDIGSGLVGGRGPAYVDFLESTVRPFVESHYGTPHHRGIIGSSLGGLISLSQALRHPGAFDLVASLSGTVGWGSIGTGIHNLTVIEEAGRLAACPAAVVYLDSGGGPGSGCADTDGDGILDDAPDAADNYCENAQLRDVLATRCGSALTYVWAAGAAHNEAAWRARAPAILALFESLP